MSILVFLTDSLFFLLVAAGLLRAWLNAARIPLWQQPGPFVMALTDWAVKPLRRAMPSRWQRSRWDVASITFACLMALCHAIALSFLGASNTVILGGGLLANVSTAFPLFAIKLFLHSGLQALLYLVIAYAVMSWVQPQASAFAWLHRLLVPVLQPLRRVIPLIGGVDLSALALVIVLQVALMLLSV